MPEFRTSVLAAAGLSIAGLVCGTMAATAGHEDHRHRRHHGVPQVLVQAPYSNSNRFTYRLNPYVGYRWSTPGVTFEIGNWGSRPSYYPHAQVWSHSGDPADLACNMPSSPCWDQDRE